MALRCNRSAIVWRRMAGSMVSLLSVYLVPGSDAVLDRTGAGALRIRELAPRRTRREAIAGISRASRPREYTSKSLARSKHPVALGSDAIRHHAEGTSRGC